MPTVQLCLARFCLGSARPDSRATTRSRSLCMPTAPLQLHFVQPTQLHPKPTKGFLCLIALSSIRAASGKESSPRPINSLSTQFNPVQPSTSTTHSQQNGPFGTRLCTMFPDYPLSPSASYYSCRSTALFQQPVATLQFTVKRRQ